MADATGRLECRPKKIKGEVFPHDDAVVVQVEARLEELATHRLIGFYEVDGRKFITIPNFKKHARPHPDEKPDATIPEPGEAVISHGKPRRAARQPREKTAVCAALLVPDCLSSDLPVADSPLLEPVQSAAQTPASPLVLRPRDELFDAIAEVTASDPKASAPHIGKVKKALLAAEPPYTPNEVRRWAAQCKPWPGSEFPGLPQLEKEIGRIRAGPGAKSSTQLFREAAAEKGILDLELGGR